LRLNITREEIFLLYNFRGRNELRRFTSRLNF
jgi:hypothetical protein